MSQSIPKILLVGAGRFGQHHLRVWQELDRAKSVEFLGAIVGSSVEAQRLAKKFQISTYHKMTKELLIKSDVVDIATPSSTHFRLTKRCLDFAHVFVEKPLTENPKQAAELLRLARRRKRVLGVGHIFRFHPMTQYLANFVKNRLPTRPRVGGKFVSPTSTWRGETAALEELHWFDVLDYLFHEEPESVWSNQIENLTEVSIRYSGGLEALLTLGWAEEIKERTLTLTYPNLELHADFKDGTIEVRKDRGKIEKVSCPPEPEPLKLELEYFLCQVRSSSHDHLIDGSVGQRMVDLAVRVNRLAKKKKRRVAIIGGGIFGLTAALHLTRRYQVTVFERHSEMMAEASSNNQYRHHVGYHYPRSVKTIEEIQQATEDFESAFEKILIRDYPSYYAVSRRDSNVTADQFENICRRFGLPFRSGYPPLEWLRRETVSACGLTSEAVIDHKKMKTWFKRELVRRGVITKTGSDVVNVSLDLDGQKVLVVKQNSRQTNRRFDYVINATYANYNRFCAWLNVPKKDIELRLKEVIVIKIPREIKPVAITIMDGPFATIVPTGIPGLYTFGDVPTSILEVKSGEEGAQDLEKRLTNIKTLWPKMRQRCLQWFPILARAKYVRSMFVILPIERGSLGTDYRSTDITSHGFGCYSIFSGKIITAVTAAKQLSEKIMGPR